jgi:serine/threonine protein kinase
MISFLCSSCGAPLRVRDEMSGARGKCPRCGQPAEAPGIDSGDLPPLPDIGRNADSYRQVFETEAVPTAGDLSFLSPPQGPGELGRLGPYRVLKVLGSGGMGVVFEAEDVRLMRRVALKAMKPSVAAKPENRQRFLREAQIAAKIDHDNVVTIYQADEDHGIPYLAMKLLQGETLEDRLKRCGGVLSLEEVLRIGREIAEGLEAAHTLGQIHRDIKPANVWLEEHTGRVKLLDFGLARGAGEDDGAITNPGMLMGTPAYMSPEQADAAFVDHRADLFSLGSVLYRMSTGRLPFTGKNTMALLLALATKVPKPPRERNPNLPPAFSKLVMRLLAKQPESRPASARDVAEKLAEIEQSVADGTAFPDVPELEVVEEAEPKKVRTSSRVDYEEVEPEPWREKSSRRPPRRRRRTGPSREEVWERRVIRFGIFVVVVVVLLIAFLIGKSVWQRYHPPAETREGGIEPPRAVVYADEIHHERI